MPQPGIGVSCYAARGGSCHVAGGTDVSRFGKATTGVDLVGVVEVACSELDGGCRTIPIQLEEDDPKRRNSDIN